MTSFLTDGLTSLSVYVFVLTLIRPASCPYRFYHDNVQLQRRCWVSMERTNSSVHAKLCTN